MIMVLAAMFGSSIYRAFDSEISTHEIIGVLESTHYVQWHTGTQDPIFIIRLPNGEHIHVKPVFKIPIVIGASTRILERKLTSGEKEYSFIGYQELTIQPTEKSR